MSVGRAVRSYGLLVLTLLAAAAAPARGHADPLVTTPDDSQAGAPFVEPCGSASYLEAALARDPVRAAQRAAYEQLVLEAQAKGLVPKAPQANSTIVYTIPVVVHIVHNNGPENISYSQVLSQIAAVNRDLQNLPANASPATDCQVQLCLATLLPQGSTVQWANANEPGVTRKQVSNPTVQMGNVASETALKAIDYLPSDQYLNVWVVAQIQGGSGGIVGFATFPGSVIPTLDGIVMDYRVMGANNTGNGYFPTLLPSNDQGKVFTHEVGHYLDLYHTFQGGCSGGDFVSDTPPEGVNAWGCPTTIPSTCTNNGGDPIHNFMDYTNDPCRWEITPGQKTRIYAAIQTYRFKLVSNANLVNTGACAPSLFATINLNTSQVCVGSPVQCSAPFCGICTYTWSFTGGTGNTSGQVTNLTFNTPGAHVVTLTMSDGTNSSTAQTTVYVSACTPITGPCANWVFGKLIRFDWSSGAPVPVAGTQNNGPESATCASNTAGALQFYTDGGTVWAANNTVMPNGNSITGGNSSHSGALAVAVPGSSSTYFLFSVREWEDGQQVDPLHYSVINMNLNGGLGDIPTGFKNLNIPLPGTPKRLMESETLVPQCNGIDWWLITVGADSTNVNNDWNKYLYVTSVTSAGPGVTTAYPIGLAGPGGNYSAWGMITASPDGSKIAYCQAAKQAVAVYNFDRVTGTPTLLLNTGPVDANQDLCFSPDGKLIYFCYLKAGTTNEYGTRQLKIATGELRDITVPLAPGGDMDVRLAPDGKVYIAPQASTQMHCINFPNNFNTNNLNECGFNPYSISVGGFPAITANYGTLPNMPPICSPSGPAPAAFTYTVTGCLTVKPTSQNCGPWNWQFGDGGTSTLQSPTHVYATPGTYTVTLTAPNASPSVVSQQVTVGNLPVSIAGPNTACGGPANYSAVGPSNYTYTWTITGGTPTSATGNNVFVAWGLSTGTVTLTATDPATGCVSVVGTGVEACSKCVTPPLGLVAWWPLDETAGTAAQEIVSANDGQDASLTAPTKVAGAVANARSYNGTSAVTRVPDNPKLDLGTGNLTLDAWVRSSTTTGTQGIVEKRLLAPDRGYALYLKQGKLAFLLGDGSTSTEYWASTANPVADGNWHHVAATEDRSGGATGTQLYVDGSPVAVFPAFASSNTLLNTEKLVIGAQEPAGAPTGWFNGQIDEVEIFTRALTATEVAGVWGAGAAGKCKEFTQPPQAQTFCADLPYVDVPVQVCNHGTTSQLFNLAFGPGSGPSCTGPTLASGLFQLLNASKQPMSNPVPAPSGACTLVYARITKPGGLTNGLVSCYQVTATNTSSNVAHVSNGALWASDALCPHVTSVPVGWGSVSTPAVLGWNLKNTSGFTRAFPISVSVAPDQDDELPPLAVLSLNGLPPGAPFTATYVLDPNDSVAVNVEADFLQARPFHFYDVVLSADSDGDGVPDLASSATVLYSDRPQQAVTAAPPAGALPTTVRLLGITPNPVRGAARVEFESPRPAWMRMGLYDVGGRRVRSLADELVGAGAGSRVLDARGLASGVYFLRMQTQGVTRTARVVVLSE